MHVTSFSLKFSSAYYCDVLSSAVGDEERRAVSRESEESSGMPMETLQTLPPEEDEFMPVPQHNGMAALQGHEEEEEGEGGRE